MRLITQGQASYGNVTTENPNRSVSSFQTVCRTCCSEQEVETDPVISPCPRRARSPDSSPGRSDEHPPTSNRRSSSSDMDSVDEAPQTGSRSTLQDCPCDCAAEHTPVSSKTPSMRSDNGPVNRDDAVSIDSQPMVSQKSHFRSCLRTYSFDLRERLHSFR